MYKGIVLQEVYAVDPADLEPYFSDWERKVREKIADGNGNSHLNNPKIPLKFVRQIGTKVYPATPPIDPAEVLRHV